MTNSSNLKRVKYDFEKDTVEPGYYTLHRPSKCNLKFPKTNRPIHKKIKDPFEGKNVIEVPQNDEWRQMIIRSGEKLVYPAICDRSKFEDIVKKASVVKPKTVDKPDPEEIRIQAELRKQKMKELQKPQPKLSKEKMVDSSDSQPELINKAEGPKDEDYQGARIANQIILGSKCHAIRDAQIVEKCMIARELEAENKRLDEMMEKARLEQLEIERRKFEESRIRKKENIDFLKNQIIKNERLKKLEADRKLRESDLINRREKEMEAEEAERLRMKQMKARNLKELLDRCNKELIDAKKRQKEEEREMEERIQKFVRQRKERDTRLKAEAEMRNMIRAKGIDTIAQKQKAEKDLRIELENLRVKKIEEDVERQYREKEKVALMKKMEDMKKLQEAREKQIADIRQQIALEATIDEEIQKSVMRKCEEDANKNDQEIKCKKEVIVKYKDSILKQIKEKELKRMEEQSFYAKEGRRLLEAIQDEENHEKQVVKRKIAEMAQQNVPTKYIKEVEIKLSKLKFI